MVDMLDMQGLVSPSFNYSSALYGHDVGDQGCTHCGSFGKGHGGGGGGKFANFQSQIFSHSKCLSF